MARAENEVTSTHWNDRAAECFARADEMKDTEAKFAMLACAENYQRLAGAAEKRERSERG